MNILALDTSMGVCSAAVLRTGPSAQLEVLRETEMLRGHAEALMPMVEAVLAEASLAPGDLDTIAATQGPGSFTGVRIAIAAARGLALTCRATLFGTDSLTVMARRALREGLVPERPFAIAVDARRGMLYFGLFAPDGSRLDGPALLTPEDAAARLPAGVAVAVGSGAGLLTEAAAARNQELAPTRPDLQPGAMTLAELAAESDERIPVLRPLYLRPPDAKPQNTALERRP
ncbi:tRNA (adenosine(37)-N6)-threonylcarbamoyltransferase complex dimerization subunit type 1 TsaB [Methyloceanibacter sp. wino2]|uniref:tRNA (adenosine(37)-N6)-threonylcarbamoyltransferase complex dimerization subunit type 1 TsaB n=1 Tax=Methyloceanibacter sp. wino2 TaxID=2170729 RepID=UPI000D3E68A1|nr:tRNA (adenosine(37)-N6)-threonylcarbamoyltransferase complex dimerization subunit type 1 TsaB [Methyloceanibacter sp. wino2]